MLDKPDELGRLIRSARLAKGIRQIDLAQYLGIGKSQMWHYEAGMAVPKISTFWDICERVGLRGMRDLRGGYCKSDVERTIFREEI